MTTDTDTVPVPAGKPALSLRLRLMLAALAPMLLAMVAAWSIATVVFTRSLEQRVADQLERAATVLASPGLPYTPEVLQRAADLQGAHIAVLDAHGVVLTGAAGPLAASVAARIAAGDVTAEASGKPFRLDVGGQPAVAVLRQLPDERVPGASAILVAASLRDAQDAARRAAFGMGLAVLAAGLLLAGLLYLLMRSITRPIHRLATMANQIAAGRRDVIAGPVPHGELAALAAALDDMTTKLRSYEAELAERSRLAALGEMSARIAHEIRNPLTGLKLHLQLMGERGPASEAATVRRLLDEVERLELIVGTSLSLGRAKPADLREDDVTSVVESVLHIMGPSLEHRGIELQRMLEPVPPARIDRDRIKQAVLNLVVNAADALPGGGTLRVGTAHDAGRGLLSIDIEDSGPGLAAGEGEATAAGGSAKPFGLGLGLRLCRDVVAEHGGVLQLGRSDALGGTRARIELPACVRA